VQESKFLVQRLLHLNRGLPGSTVYDFRAGRQLAPATRMRTSGSYWSSRLHASVGSTASATSVRMFALVLASSVSAGPGDRDHLAAWAFGISLCVSTQEIMHAGDGQGSITHCGCDAFGCAEATVAGRENSGT